MSYPENANRHSATPEWITNDRESARVCADVHAEDGLVDGMLTPNWDLAVVLGV